MTLLFSCQNLSKSFGSKVLFKELSFSIFSEDRLGLIGPNGCGKSTLLKILAGCEPADDGTLSPRKGLKIGYVPQSCDFQELDVKEILIATLQNSSLPDYEKAHLAELWLSKMGFKENMPKASFLSGGWKKRLSLSQALILSPDVLLLDEPTNHLDLEGILWLEKFLKKEALTYVLVSHDRYFLKNTTSKMIEINPTYPKGMLAIDGSYSYFLSKKEEFLKGQLQYERSLASKARKETHWLRQSPKARTTKSQSRVDSAHELIEELSDVSQRNRQQRAQISFNASERETRKLLVAKNLGKKIEDKPLFSHLDFTLSPGSRLGLMGPNGSGKTTLLRLLAGEISPDEGTLKRADDLQIVYFDQHRNQLPLNMTLREALSPQGDYVFYQGQPVHVNGWCKRFLFNPDTLDMPLEKLSGGERARISIAHLMLQPADILLLDEPTNDLDIPTLETLESSLMQFPGAVVLITHDRCMLDRICNAFLALGTPGNSTLYADYSQWEASIIKSTPSESKPKEIKPPSPPKVKLSYLEKREYDQIEGKILHLEEELGKLNQLLETSEITQDPKKLQEMCTATSLLQSQIEQLYLRWDELDKKSQN